MSKDHLKRSEVLLGYLAPPLRIKMRSNTWQNVYFNLMYTSTYLVAAQLHISAYRHLLYTTKPLENNI